MGAKVQHRIRPPEFIQEGVVGGKAVVGAGRAGEQQPHRVALVAKGGLHPNKHITKGLTVDQQVFPIGVKVARRWAPVFLQAIGVGGEGLVFPHRHAVGHVQLGALVLGLGIVDHLLHQGLGGVRQVLDIVAILLHGLHHPVDGAKHIQVGGGAHVPLIRGKAKDGDGQFFI